MTKKLFFLYPVVFYTFLSTAQIKTGAEQLHEYIHILKNKNVAVVVNHTSMIGSTHLVDTLLGSGILIKAIFSPEHGFSGAADAGERIQNTKKESIPVYSLYGSQKKPTSSQLKGIDIVVFDMQDVGARFYTYISTMHYVMEACAENNLPLIILDRPNPNGQLIDGPILKKGFVSFVGMHTIPVSHGLTVGELARMINGEGWLDNGKKCNVTIVKLTNWTHQTPYSLPTKPSPNLPNDLAVAWYPSLCFFEGTIMSVGRGTPFPFQVYGHPDYSPGKDTFTPMTVPGAKNPPFLNQRCTGVILTQPPGKTQLHLEPLITTYQFFEKKGISFFNDYFDTLAGTDELRRQITAGKTIEEIRSSWQQDLTKYAALRQKYLLYP